MQQVELPFRQVHLDFHTSEMIDDVAAQFDPEEFAATLERAHVNSVTCFARCHHGWIYYDTKAFPERRHPHLTRNLLEEQIEACHARGIRVPIYITVQWDHYTASEHPEWLMIDEQGRPLGTPPFEPGFYRTLCVNSPYRELLKAMTKEVLELLPVDGLFFDIVGRGECACRYCRARMIEEGLEPSDSHARRQFAQRTHNGFVLDMSRYVRQLDESCSVYYNYKNIGPGNMGAAESFTHFEFDALPGDPSVGYMRFPTLVRYFRNAGKDCLGHTGKFHTTWGDFHSLKNKAALEYECYHLIALGAKCLVGDQLHPSGRVDRPVYDLIGSVYSEVERKEPWCRGAAALTDIGVLSPDEFTQNEIALQGSAILGAARMLQESAQQFDIVDSTMDFSRYKVLVLPDHIPVESEFAVKLEQYLAGGGAIIASFESGLNGQKAEFSLKSLGARLRPSPTRGLDGKLVRGRHFPNHDYADYLLPKGAIGRGLPETEHVMYMKGVEIDAESSTEVLADVILPYFDRTYRHFCSHRQTPSSGKAGYPGIVLRGRVVYFGHPIFTQYNQNAPRWCKTLFLNALAMLLPEPLLTHDGPSTVLATLSEQASEKRWVVHLLHYVPERRGRDMDVVEDVIPLHGLTVSVRAPRPVRAVVLAPEDETLPFDLPGGRVEFVVPKLVGHQMIALSLGQ